MKIDEIELGAMFGAETGTTRRGYAAATDVKVQAVEIVVEQELGYRARKPRNVRRVKVQLVPDPGAPEGGGRRQRALIRDAKVGDFVVVDAAQLHPFDEVEGIRTAEAAHRALVERARVALDALGLLDVAESGLPTVRAPRFGPDETAPPWVRFDVDLARLEEAARIMNLAESIVRTDDAAAGR